MSSPTSRARWLVEMSDDLENAIARLKNAASTGYVADTDVARAAAKKLKTILKVDHVPQDAAVLSDGRVIYLLRRGDRTIQMNFDLAE